MLQSYMITQVAIPVVTQSIVSIVSFTLRSSVYVLKQLFHSSFSKQPYGMTYFYEQIKRMDLENDLLFAQQVLYEVIQQKVMSQHQTLILKGIQDHIQSIYDLLWKCQEKIEIHKQKWFMKYRSFDLSEEIVQLREKQHILKQRFQWLYMFPRDSISSFPSTMLSLPESSSFKEIDLIPSFSFSESRRLNS